MVQERARVTSSWLIFLLICLVATAYVFWRWGRAALRRRRDVEAASVDRDLKPDIKTDPEEIARDRARIRAERRGER